MSARQFAEIIKRGLFVKAADGGLDTEEVEVPLARLNLTFFDKQLRKIKMNEGKLITRHMFTAEGPNICALLVKRLTIGLDYANDKEATAVVTMHRVRPGGMKEVQEIIATVPE